MPLPWKKAKGSRISKLVADHLQPPNCGGSLVVETGFPTSLVDLFVKNRDRLRKPSRRMRSKTLDPIISPGEIPPCYSYTNPNTTPVTQHYNQHPRNPSPWMSPIRNEGLVRDMIGRLESDSSVVGSGTDGGGGETVDVKGVFVAVLKMFLVVVLALGTKKFMFGIGLSGMLLFFFEYVMKHWHRSLEPCSNAPKRLKSVIKTVWCYCHLKHYKMRAKEEDSVMFGASVVQEAKEENKSNYAYEMSSCSNASGLEEHKRPSTPVEGFEIVQPNLQLLPLAEKFHRAREKLDFVSSDNSKEMDCKEMDNYKGVLDKGEDSESDMLKARVHGSHRAKLKSKMKELFPKKLCSRRKSGNAKVDPYLPIEEAKTEILEEQVEDEDGKWYECDDKMSSLSSERYGQEDVVISGSCSELLPCYVKFTPVREDLGRETSGNSGYLVLCLIVLLGLISGRILALLLTVLACLMMKSGEGLRRYVKIPMIKSLTDFYR